MFFTVVVAAAVMLGLYLFVVRGLFLVAPKLNVTSNTITWGTVGMEYGASATK